MFFITILFIYLSPYTTKHCFMYLVIYFTLSLNLVVGKEFNKFEICRRPILTVQIWTNNSKLVIEEGLKFKLLVLDSSYLSNLVSEHYLLYEAQSS